MIQPEKTSKYAVVVSLLTLCFIACNGKASEISNHSSNPIVTIERFDKGLRPRNRLGPNISFYR